jgi:Protein of unknown function (DUF2550)
LLGGRAALDAGWLLVVILAIALACATGIAVRRTLIERGGGSVDCALRRGTDLHWRLGVASYQGDQLCWFPIFGFRLRPREVFARRGLSVVSRRPADAAETTSIGAGAVVVECDTGHGAGHVELALSDDALTGFLAWLEAAPPGSVTEFR